MQLPWATIPDYQDRVPPTGSIIRRWPYDQLTAQLAATIVEYHTLLSITLAETDIYGILPL